MTTRRIQEVLDANTERIPESLYVQLSNEVMRLHNQPNFFFGHAVEAVERLHEEVEILEMSLREANSRERSLRRQLTDLRNGGELARLSRELEVRKKVNADSVTMYKKQITDQCAKIVEYKAKIRELSEKMEQKGKPVEIPTTTDPLPNPWLTHLKEWTKANNVNYATALKDPKCKEAYWVRKRQVTIT